jgi:uncharacterized damage-inducible protein DinB
MSRKDVILEQFLYCHNKNGWFVSFQNAVAGLTPEQAAWKSSESDNSIWELVNHLVFWSERYLNRFKGIPIQEMEGNNDTTFINKRLEWQEVVDKFNAVMTEWYDAVYRSEEEKLEQLIGEDKKEPWIEALTNITIHTAYHIGQIVSIRKIQGSWNKEQGVS